VMKRVCKGSWCVIPCQLISRLPLYLIH
jgi:hypothetical protein